MMKMMSNQNITTGELTELPTGSARNSEPSGPEVVVVNLNVNDSGNNKVSITSGTGESRVLTTRNQRGCRVSNKKEK